MANLVSLLAAWTGSVLHGFANRLGDTLADEAEAVPKAENAISTVNAACPMTLGGLPVSRVFGWN
jgi:hypothetical protein